MGDRSGMEQEGIVTTPVKVGVLAVQGDFAEHGYHLQAAAKSLDCQLNVVEVRKPEQLEDLQGLIIPGGESTTMGHFLQRGDFNGALRTWITGKDGGTKPIVWGTCAGLILLSNKLNEQKQGGQYTIGGIDVTSCRNMYGRQIASFEAPLVLHDPQLHEENLRCNGVFIRAPGIKSVDNDKVKVLATLTHQDETTVVAVEQGKLMVSSFHPELTDDFRWHKYFLRKVLGQL